MAGQVATKVATRPLPAGRAAQPQRTAAACRAKRQSRLRRRGECSFHGEAALSLGGVRFPGRFSDHAKAKAGSRTSGGRPDTPGRTVVPNWLIVAALVAVVVVAAVLASGGGGSGGGGGYWSAHRVRVRPRGLRMRHLILRAGRARRFPRPRRLAESWNPRSRDAHRRTGLRRASARGCSARAQSQGLRDLRKVVPVHSRSAPT
jgi:hypothetical protein